MTPPTSTRTATDTASRSYPRPGAPAPVGDADDDYVAFCVQLHKLCGIDLLQYKRGQMERRLRAFYAKRGVTDLRSTFADLKADRTHLEELLDRVTINVSQLWRNPEQWDLIETKLIPELSATGHIDAWSAGCSYGAEAHTLATLLHLAGAGTRFSAKVRGTDIDRRMVARARRGEFSSEDARSAPAHKLESGFSPLPDGGLKARPAVAALTQFEIGDLLTMSPRKHSFDLILCRNTVIYFNEPIRDELHARLADALRPGGFFMVGSTERVARAAALGLAPAHPFIYRKN